MRCRRAVVLASRPQPSFINASAVAQPKQRRLPNVLRQSLEAAADGRITPTPQQVRAFRGAEQDVEATGYRRDITDVAQGCPKEDQAWDSRETERLGSNWRRACWASPAANC